MDAMSRSREEFEVEAWFRQRYGRGSSHATRVLEQRLWSINPVRVHFVHDASVWERPG
jgi:hypothetical protein